jgi:hypothetical protein
VDVVEHDEEGLLTCDRAEQCRRRVEKAEARALGVE